MVIRQAIQFYDDNTYEGNWLLGQLDLRQLASEKKALAVLVAAPIEKLFKTFAGQVWSRGKSGF